MNFIKPKKLNQGDTVAIISPSWGGPSIFPHIYNEGIRVLEQELGLKVKEYPSARRDAVYLYKHPEFRAKDINKAFADKKVKAIFASIGGDDSIRILKYLDKDIITKNPKIVMGYSDFTTINTYLNQLGLITYNGPCIMAGFSQWRSLPAQYQNHIREFLFDSPKTYVYKKYNGWVDGYPSWSKEINAGKINKWNKNKDGWHWLSGRGLARGKLFGGCIEVLQDINGTPFWPQSNFWNGKILFLETSEDKITVDQVKYMLRNYGIQGVYNRVSAILFGRARDYTTEEKKELDQVILSVVVGEFGQKDMPIISNMDFGHTDPQFIMPLGIKAEVNVNKKEFRLAETPFAN